MPSSLPRYKSHKEVNAVKIEAISGPTIWPEGPFPSFNVSKEYLEKHKPTAGGYFVVYADGYESWSPAEAFEEGYTLIQPTDGMTFEQALQLVKQGRRVARRGWNGKGMFIYLVPGSMFEVNRPPLSGIYADGTLITYRPHVDMRDAEGKCVPWLASQTDLLADDWMEVS